MSKKIRFARVVNTTVDLDGEEYSDDYLVIMDSDFDEADYEGTVYIDETVSPTEEIEVLCEVMDSYSEGENYHNDIGKPKKICDMVASIAGIDGAVQMARMLYQDRDLFGGY